MASCATCGTTILFGGSRDGELRFCNAACQRKGSLVRVAQSLPPDLVAQQTSAVYRGACPQCSGPGPIDVHTAYRVWSALFLTSWQSNPAVSCRSCGRKRQALAALFSLLLGWWGFPWGLIMTPVQVGRNVWAMLKSTGEDGPSKELHRATGLILASQVARQQSGSA